MRRLHLILPLALLGACADTPYSHGDECRLGEVERASNDYALPSNKIEGLPNFAQVAPGLYRSGQPTAKGFEAAKKMGIRTVINITWLASDRSEMRGLGMNYVHISFSPFHPEDEDVVAFLQIVTDPKYQPVLVHCRHGADRTGVMIAIYRHMVQGWTMQHAMHEMDLFDFHPSMEHLKDYLVCLNCSRIREQVSKATPPRVLVIE
jgi:protein tyrosine/serine phosphatase